MNEKTYKMKFECKNCFNKFTEDIPYGKKLKVESGVGYHEIYYGLNRIKGTVIECPKCGTSDDIYKVKREEKEKEIPKIGSDWEDTYLKLTVEGVLDLLEEPKVKAKIQKIVNEGRLEQIEQRLSTLSKVLEHLVEFIAEEQGINIEGLKEVVEKNE